MAIDPTIALGLRPVESPLDSYGKALQIQNMQTQGKMGQLGLQQAQTQMNQQQALNAAYADPANRNPDGSINYQGVSASLAKANAGAQIPGVMKAGLETQKALTDAQLNQMKLSQAKLDRVTDHITGLMQKKDLTYDDVKATMDNALQSGDIDQGAYQRGLSQFQPGMSAPAIKALLAQQAMSVYATGAKLQAFMPKPKLETVGGQLVPTTTTEATGEMTAGKPLVSTPVSGIGKLTQDINAGLVPPADQANARYKETHNAAMINMGGGFGGGGRINPGAATAGADGGPDLSQVPASIRSTIKALGEYRADPSKVLPRGKERQVYVNYLTSLYPNWNENDAEQATKMLKDLASSSPTSAGGQVQAINNIGEHLKIMLDNNKALGGFNGALSPLNYLKVGAESASGDPALARWNSGVNYFSAEGQKLVKGGVATQQEVEDAIAPLKAVKSPEARSAALATAAQFFYGKIEGLEDRLQSIVGAQNAPNSLLSAQAQQNFARAIQEAGLEVPHFKPPRGGGNTKTQIANQNMPVGATQSVPTPSSGRPTATGANGEKYQLSADGKSWELVK